MHIFNKSNAAAIAYRLDKEASSLGKTNLLVSDQGGMTFEVSIFTMAEWIMK